MTARGWLRKRISYEERQRRQARKLQKLRQRRIKEEGWARLKSKERNEIRRIKRARASVKSGSPALEKWGKEVLRQSKPFIKKAKPHVKKLLKGTIFE